MLRVLLAALFAVALASVAAEDALALSASKQTLVDMLRQRNPQKADRIEQRLKQIDESNATPEEKRKQEDDFLRKEKDKAVEDLKLSGKIGSKEGQIIAGEVQSILLALWELAWKSRSEEEQHDYVQHEEGGLLADTALQKEYGESYKRLTEERAKAAADQKAKEAKTPAQETPRQGSFVFPSNGGGDVGTALAGYWGVQNQPDIRYIGREHLGQQFFGEEGFDDSYRYTGGGFDIAVNLAHRPGSGGSLRGTRDAIHLGGFFSNVSDSWARNEFHPDGDFLLIPFVTSSGIFLTDPGLTGANRVTDLRYRFESESRTFYAKYARSWICDEGALTGYAGLAQTNINQNQVFTGRIPGYLSSLRYDTSFDVDVTRILIGARGDYRLNSVDGLTLNGGLMGLVNFVDADGRDSVSLPGLIGLSDSGRLGVNDTTVGFVGTLGASYQLTPGVSIYAGYFGAFDQTALVSVREDAGPAHGEIEDTWTHTFTFATRLEF